MFRKEKPMMIPHMAIQCGFFQSRMIRLGWAETKLLFCVLLAKLLLPAQQGVVPAPIRISLVGFAAGVQHLFPAPHKTGYSISFGL
jgi:hypothetical protein